MSSTLLRSALTVTLAAGALALSACDDPAGVDEHLDVEGFALVEDGTEIYRYTLDDGSASILTLTRGVHDVAFVLLDHDGQPLSDEGHDDEEHEEHELQIDIADTSVLTWTPEAEEHDEAHSLIEFHGELNALQVSATTMNVCVPHAGHCDFDVDVPVTVAEN